MDNHKISLGDDGELLVDMKHNSHRIETEHAKKKQTEELTYCEVHPERETGLRCNRCERYMCPECAVQTAVGYRCRECARQQDDRFFNATQTDPLIILAICAGMGLLGGAIVVALGGLGLFAAIILGFPAGAAMGEAALRSIQYRKGRNNAQAGAVGVGIGGFIGAAMYAATTYPDEYREVYEYYQIRNVPVPREIAAYYPAFSDYVFNHVFTISVLAFVAIAAYAIYNRMKV
jgi:hypothetical protein